VAKGKTITLESLSPLAQSAIQERKLAGMDSFKNWRKLFSELVTFDSQTDVLIQAAKKRMTTFII
jgi:hypothetical protein